MPVRKLPDPLKKRDLLYDAEKSKTADFVGIADTYVEGGRLSEALQFYHRAAALDKIRDLKARAIESADAPLLIAIADLLTDDVVPADWERLAATAERAEKFSSAAEAYDRAGQPGMAARARERLDEVLGRQKPPPGEDGPDGPSDDDAPSDPRPGQAGHQAKIGG